MQELPASSPIRTTCLGDLILGFFDFGVEKLFPPAALQARQRVVMAALVELEHRLATFEMVADQTPNTVVGVVLISIPPYDFR